MSLFRADCSNCCGLCCVVPDFLALQGFRVDKLAETPCTRLNSLHRFSIHATRELVGYAACKGFDCFGVGQWITQSLFKGASWTNAPDVARQMFDAYRHWAPRFEAAALLEAALPYVRADARSPIVARIEALTTAAPASDFGPIDARQLRRETIQMIRSALQADAEIAAFENGTQGAINKGKKES
jgi:hypothetical protein